MTVIIIVNGKSGAHVPDHVEVVHERGMEKYGLVSLDGKDMKHRSMGRVMKSAITVEITMKAHVTATPGEPAPAVNVCTC